MRSTPLPTQRGYGAFISAAHIVWFGLVAFFFSTTRVGPDPAVRHWIHQVFGALLVGFALMLAQASVSR